MGFYTQIKPREGHTYFGGQVLLAFDQQSIP